MPIRRRCPVVRTPAPPSHCARTDRHFAGTNAGQPGSRMAQAHPRTCQAPGSSTSSGMSPYRQGRQVRSSSSIAGPASGCGPDAGQAPVATPARAFGRVLPPKAESARWNGGGGKPYKTDEATELGEYGDRTSLYTSPVGSAKVVRRTPRYAAPT